MQLIRTGKVKSVYTTDKEDEVLIIYHDKVTAGNGRREDYPKGKGTLCCQISKWFFEDLSNTYLTHYISCPDDNIMLCKKLNIIPVEVICRNKAAGSLCRDLGLKEGMNLCSPLGTPLIEFNLKDDEKDDPLLSPDRVKLMGYNPDTLADRARDINCRLIQVFDKMGLTLVDFKLEFGLSQSGVLFLADEISPDNMRLWKKDTNESMDKDLFRKDKGDIVEAYTYILDSLRL